MASGAPKPGGYSVIPPGGYRATPAGGTDMNDRTNRLQYDGYPTLDVTPETASGGLVQVTRTAVVRLGRAASVAYAWTLPTKPGASTATVSNGTTATASFTADLAGSYVFRCTATFSDGLVLVKNVTYTAA